MVPDFETLTTDCLLGLLRTGKMLDEHKHWLWGTKIEGLRSLTQKEGNKIVTILLQRLIDKEK